MKSSLTIFVINLVESIERRRVMMQRLQKAGLEAEFFDASDGRRLSTSDLPEKLQRSSLSKGEIGCYLSHLRLWQTVVERDLSFALILEDDVHLDSGLGPWCKTVAACGLPFDMVRMSALDKREGPTIIQFDPAHRLVLPTKSPTGTQGYLISQAGARRLLQALPAHPLPIDCELNFYWRYDLRVLLMDPPLVFHDEQFSSSISSTGRALINTSLNPLSRVSRSLQKRAALRRISAALEMKKSSPPGASPPTLLAYFQRIFHRRRR